MPTTDPRVDAYIQQAGDFAKPILTKLRAMVHKGCPDVVETIKWGMPAFEHKGPFCGMAAFKKHCTFGFWKAQIIFSDKRFADVKAADKLQWGVKGSDPTAARITDVRDLPTDAAFLRIIKEAKRLNDEGVALPPRKAATATVPKDFSAALNKSKPALATFKALAPSHKREYIKWITSAKRDQTRQTRIATAVQWLAEGKSRDWKYQRK